MTVCFNYFEDLGQKRFLLKHLDQEFLYLLIEYHAAKPTFFDFPDESVSFTLNNSPLELKWFQDYECPSEKISKISAMPWSAYVLTSTHHTHFYHVVYEVSDPQRQKPETLILLKTLKEKSKDDFLKCRLYSAYQNVFSENVFLGSLASPSISTLTLFPSKKILFPLTNHIFYISIQLQEFLTFSLTMTVTEYRFFIDHLEAHPIFPIPKNTYFAKLSRETTFEYPIDESGSVVIKSGKLKKRSAFTLSMVDFSRKIEKIYSLLIRTGDPREKIWDSKKPIPFPLYSKKDSITFENIPNFIKKNLLDAYHEDYETFWGITKERHAPLFYLSKEAIYTLPFNFYFALILQKMKWEEFPFQTYIRTSLALQKPGYYFYEKDPRYSRLFHLYYLKKLKGNELFERLTERFHDFAERPLDIWSSIDALECLNFCYIAKKESHKKYALLTQSMLDLFLKRLDKNPYATAFHAPHHKQASLISRIETISPQGLAVLACLQGFQLFKNEIFRKQAFLQLNFLLKTYPIEKQKFIEKDYDDNALVYTVQALKKMSFFSPEFKTTLDQAKKKMIKEFRQEAPYLPLSTQIEILDLTTKTFYCYF